MLLDVVLDERAQRNDFQAVPRCLVERAGGEDAAKALAFVVLGDFDVCERDRSVAPPVGGNADQTPAEAELEARGVAVGDHLCVLRAAPRRLQLRGTAEVLDKLPGRVGAASVDVVGEAPAVRSRVLP